MILLTLATKTGILYLWTFISKVGEAMTIKPIILEDHYVSLTWDEWVEQFKPIKNHITKYPNTEATYESFETYGEEVDFVISKAEENLVWTFSDGDMCTYLSNGYHYINRINYYVCTVPYDPDKTYEIIVSTEQECACYIEEGYPSIVGDYPENGDPDCPECEGYGLVTVYND
jgi:hypothetical protein